MGRQSNSTEETEERSFVQRLLIYYPDLPKICEATIDESSSFEELAEKILYFHSGRSFNFEDSDTCEYATEEAVQFMGLCEALYAFPSAFSNDDNDVQDCIHSYVNIDDLSWDDLVFAFGDGSRIVVGEMVVLAWDRIVRCEEWHIGMWEPSGIVVLAEIGL